MESHKSLLANASHELRSPLARIRMGLELMGIDAASPQRQEISRSITELDQLIDEILLASRLDAKQADAEPFETLDLTGLAAEECARVNAELSAELGKAPDTGLGMDATSHSLTVQGSPRLLRRLIRNLLENARRYSTGDINLELAQARVGSKQLAVVKVHDRGPGVPAGQRERIFEPFYRLPGASEREGGVGLGLALVKSISQRHGGSVRCEARPGGGASFIVELPVAHAMAPAIP
jgi:signal transduction histidine kinase